MIEFIGPNDEELTIQEWEELFQARSKNLAPESWWRKETFVEGVQVSTVWLGLPINDDGLGIWETMVFGGEFDGHQWKYATRQEAYDDHERIIREVRVMHQ